MAVRMVRQPSETPNIRNVDDIIGLRYAYGNQNGYVKDRGAELSYTVNGLTFTINSGRIVLQGVESDVDANGVSFSLDNISEKRYFTIYYKVNLATNTTSIELSNYDTAEFPAIDPGDDLTEMLSGTASLPLYHFIVQDGVISNVEKVVKVISYPLENYDISKGTVEERLTNLGFKQGSFTIIQTGTAQLTVTTNKIVRQGNFCIGNFQYSFSGTGALSVAITVPEGFRPTQDVSVGLLNDNAYTYIGYRLTISPSGECSLTGTAGSVGQVIMLNAGWEAAPL